MKRGTHEHPKLLHLCAILNLQKFEAVGILEMLWHFTAKFAPQGDIGKYSDEAIAKAVGWQRPTGTKGVTPGCRLSDALVEAKWLDRDPVHRLIVHDWEEHADQTLKRLLASRKLAFIRPAASLPEPEPVASSQKPERVPAPPPPRASPTAQPIDYGSRYRAIYDRHIVPGFQQDGEYEYCKLIESAMDPAGTADAIEAAHGEWTAFFREHPEEYRPGIGKWLKDGYWTRKPEARASPRRTPSKQQQLADRIRALGEN